MKINRRTLLTLGLLSPLASAINLLKHTKTDFERDTEKYGQAFYVWTGNELNHDALGRPYHGRFWCAVFDKENPFKFESDEGGERSYTDRMNKYPPTTVTAAMFFIKGGGGPIFVHYEDGKCWAHGFDEHEKKCMVLCEPPNAEFVIKQNRFLRQDYCRYTEGKRAVYKQLYGGRRINFVDVMTTDSKRKAYKELTGINTAIGDYYTI